MSREFRVASVLLVLALVLAAPALAAESSADETTLVFDLASTDAVVGEHTARLLWNLSTDNIIPERADVLSGWNSLYLENPGTVSGKVVVDSENGTVSGDIVERWVCANDCVTIDGTPSWTTTRNTGWTATIVDGRIEPAADGWTISGQVAIHYNAVITSIESASDCDGTPCYVCEERICKVSGQETATVDLEGWTDGETLSIAFADQLEDDVAAMDFSSLRTTEFFMSRFAFAMMGVVAPAVVEPPPDEPAADTSETTKTSSSDTAAGELPGGQLLPGIDAGSPPSGFGDDPVPEEGTAADSPGGEPTSTEKETAIGGFIFAVALLIGVAAAILLVRQILKARQKRTPIEQATLARNTQQAAKEASAWFRDQATHVIEPGQFIWVWNPALEERAKALGDELEGVGPLPLSVQVLPHRADEAGPLLSAEVVDGVTVVYDPANPDVAVLRTGAQIRIRPEQLIPLSSDDFAPTHELVGTKTIPGQGEDAGYALSPGTPVQVITTTGDKTLVRIDDKKRMWVPRSSVGPATAQIDKPS